MSAAYPAATLTGPVLCALCGQCVTRADETPMKEVASLVRAHQRSEGCG